MTWRRVLGRTGGHDGRAAHSSAGDFGGVAGVS